MKFSAAVKLLFMAVVCLGLRAVALNPGASAQREFRSYPLEADATRR